MTPEHQEPSRIPGPQLRLKRAQRSGASGNGGVASQDHVPPMPGAHATTSEMDTTPSKSARRARTARGNHGVTPSDINSEMGTPPPPGKTSPRPRRQGQRLTETELYWRQSVIALIPILVVLVLVIGLVSACILLNAPVWLTLGVSLFGTGGLGTMVKAFYDALPNIGGRR